MKIIDAVWDYEVLGVKSVEVRCDVDDSTGSIFRTLMELEKSHKYIVTKIPVSNTEFLVKAPDAGYKFIETLISVERSVKKSSIDSRLVKRASALSAKKATAEELAFVLEQIMRGIFSTDRISLDENFGPRVGAQRYCNWIDSEIKQGGEVYTISLSTRAPLGFFTLRVTDDGVAHSILSGVFDADKSPGFGLILLSIILTKAEEKGAKKIVSAISSNNLPVVRTHVQLGFEVKDVNYVFIRHLP
jgi:hypothetical protein